MQKNTKITAVHIPGEGCYCPCCYKEQPKEELEALITAIVHLSSPHEGPEWKEKRKKHFQADCLQGIRALWTHNGINRMEERAMWNLDMFAYDPRFPAQPMTPQESKLWQLVCHDCPHDEKGWLSPGEAVLYKQEEKPRMAGTLMTCRACKTWQGRVLECVACGRILA